MTDTLEDLRTSLRARYAVVFVRTEDKESVVNAVIDKQKTFLGNVKKITSEEFHDLAQRVTKANIFIDQEYPFDGHSTAYILEDPDWNQTTCGDLACLANFLMGTHHSVVLISNAFEVPIGMEKILEIIDISGGPVGDRSEIDIASAIDLALSSCLPTKDDYPEGLPERLPIREGAVPFLSAFLSKDFEVNVNYFVHMWLEDADKERIRNMINMMVAHCMKFAEATR